MDSELRVLTKEILWPGERKLVAQFFCVDEMGIACEESERERFPSRDVYSSPVVITTLEHVPRVRRPPPIPPGIRDKDRKPNEGPSVESVVYNMQKVLEIPIMSPTQESVSSISPDIHRSVKELVMTRQACHPGQMNSFARSYEKINCRRGFPVPETRKGVLFSGIFSFSQRHQSLRRSKSHSLQDNICVSRQE